MLNNNNNSRMLNITWTLLHSPPTQYQYSMLTKHWKQGPRESFIPYPLSTYKSCRVRKHLWKTQKMMRIQKIPVSKAKRAKPRIQMMRELDLMKSYKRKELQIKMLAYKHLSAWYMCVRIRAIIENLTMETAQWQ